MQSAQGGQKAKKETAEIFFKPWAKLGPTVDAKHTPDALMDRD